MLISNHQANLMNKCRYVAVIAKPNISNPHLINNIVGEKVKYCDGQTTNHTPSNISHRKWANKANSIYWYTGIHRS